MKLWSDNEICASLWKLLCIRRLLQACLSKENTFEKIWCNWTRTLRIIIKAIKSIIQNLDKLA